MITLNVDNITIRIGEKYFFKNFTWQPHGGQLWAMIGRNGSGKSTLMQCMANMSSNYSGSITIDGTDIKTMNAVRLAQHVSFLFQNPEMKYQHTPLEVVMANRYPWRDESFNDIAIAHEQLEHMQMLSLAHRPYENLSGGEQQRVEIAAILSQDTPILLLDEPLNHLDIVQRHRIMTHLKKLAIEKNKLIIMTIHDMGIAQKYCSHCLGLLGNDGDIIIDEMVKINLDRTYAKHVLNYSF